MVNTHVNAKIRVPRLQCLLSIILHVYIIQVYGFLHYTLAFFRPPEGFSQLQKGLLFTSIYTCLILFSIRGPHRILCTFGKITHWCSAKYRVYSHLRHILMRSLARFCLVGNIIASETLSGESTHRCSVKFKVLSHLRHLLVRSLTGVLLS